jgi:hypothetical protein
MDYSTKSSSSQPSIMIQKMKETIEQSLPINKIPRSSNNNSSSNRSNNNSNNSWHISNIQNQQQLLILLFHARSCHYTGDNAIYSCPIAGAQCTEAKRMWNHIANECTNKYNCSYCYSSRYVLTHYRECKDGDACQICCPVREEIRRKKQQQQLLVGGGGGGGQQQHHQQQQQQQITMKTADTFSTSMMTPSTTGITAKVNNVHSKMTMGGAGGAATGAGGGENQKLFPTLTVAICRSADNVGKIIQVRRAAGSTTSNSSCSSLSHSIESNSVLSSVPSSIRSTTASGRTKPYFVKDRENPGIAHFLEKDFKANIPEEIDLVEESG